MNSTGHGATANKPQKNHEGMAAMGHRRSGGMAGMGKKDHAKKAAAPETKVHGGIAAGAARPPGWLGVVLRWGPEILVASVLLIVVSVAQRRPRAALLAIVVGTVLLVFAYATSLRRVKREAQ